MYVALNTCIFKTSQYILILIQNDKVYMYIFMYYSTFIIFQKYEWKNPLPKDRFLNLALCGK